jgi:hypothetical protein
MAVTIRTKLQDILNRMTPGAYHAKVGDQVYDLTNGHNDLLAAYKRLLAKLDTANIAGGGNAAAAGPVLAPVLLPEARK